MLKLIHSQKDFAKKFDQFLHDRDYREGKQDIAHVVKDIIENVVKDKDKAVIHFTQKFDDKAFNASKIRISKQEITKARKACGKDVVAALEHAVKRIRAYHKKQLPKDASFKDAQGVKLGWRWNAIDSVGLYVPGGKASYPSSVLMNAIPALVAGVKRLAMVVPAPSGNLNPAILAAADIAGVTEIYRIGGAQAVAALAYGTQTIAPVDKIVGPGNAYVAEAKRQVFGKVGIDMIAGPSEILVVADNKNNPDWIAADLLSQAEHDEMAQAILITDDAAFASKVEASVAKVVGKFSHIAKTSWDNLGTIIILRDLKDAPALIDRIAPEHLELAVANPAKLSKAVRHAGAIFLGRYTPEAMGDYIAGPSHVLPTSATARFSSGLSVYDFLKRTSLIECDARSAKKIGKDAALLAKTEGLPAHELSLLLRL